MSRALPRIHVILGILAFLAFVHSGIFMRTSFPALYGSDMGMRYLYRASHIYILLAALLNVLGGTYLVLHGRRGVRIAQWLGSAMILAATMILVLSFHFEPKTGPERPFTSAGIFLLLGGTGLHAIAGWVARRSRRSPSHTSP
jgi:hypothetical protein